MTNDNDPLAEVHVRRWLDHEEEQAAMDRFPFALAGAIMALTVVIGWLVWVATL